MSEGLKIPQWVEARPYQKEAISAWLGANGKGILNMATGTGKTVTALSAAAKISGELDGNLALVIAVPYQHLVDQWAEDLSDFGQRPILAYRSRQQWQPRLEREIMEFNIGARSSFVVITTHDTFASDPFQKSIDRINRCEKMVIADEVHHLGAPHLQTGLPETFVLRLGLSATPKRWYDEEGTKVLFDYFGGGVIYEYSLQEAIDSGALCEYYYVPHIIGLNDEEAETYITLSKTIGRLASRADGDLSDADLQENQSLKQALFRRARLVGTAENKLPRLKSLLQQEESVKHTLVYCGDGSVEDELTGNEKRHVDAAVGLLQGELNLSVHRFTARESQSTRQDLLRRFEGGDLQALVAIRCLDEGVDVPATRSAYMLASSSNPRQFVQRRGRILRQHQGKEYAVIHDFIVAPPYREHPKLLDEDIFNTERKMVKKELERVNTFAEAARNHPDAELDNIPSDGESLRELKRKYNLMQM